MVTESDPFLQDDGETMKNRVGITHDPDAVALAERELSFARGKSVENVTGNFDEQHIRAIHQHLFQDIYEWAGTTRADTIELEGETINVPAALPELGKGSTDFLESRQISRGLAAVEELANSEAAQSADPDKFAFAAADVLSTLNHTHPFREGNGRTQRVFMEQLAERAGHTLSFEGVTGERMTEASLASIQGDDGPFRSMIAESIDPERVALRIEAVAALETTGVEAQGFWVETASPGQSVEGTMIARSETHASVVDDENHFIVLPAEAVSPDLKIGDSVALVHQPPTATDHHDRAVNTRARDASGDDYDLDL